MVHRNKSSRVLAGLAVLALAATLLPSSSVAAPPPAPSYACGAGATPRANATKIMIAGDSITNASAGDYTWRYWLWRNLHGRGAAVDFVGRFKDTLVAETLVRGNRQYLDCSFDFDHEARPGLRLYHADSSKASYTRPFTSSDPYQPSYPGQTSWIRGAVAKYKPAIVVAFAGVNDVAFPYAQGTNQQVANKAISFLKTFINQARLGNPGVDIVLTTVATRGSGETKYTLYNKALPKVVSSLSTTASKLVLATMPNWASQSWDSVHPNSRGEVAIAATLTAALKKLRPSFPGRPATLQKPPIGPRVKPVVTATAGGFGSKTINLSWTLPPGTNRTLVYIRNASANGSWLLRTDLVMGWFKTAYPGSANRKSCGTTPCKTLAVTGLSAGTTYEFRVRSAKGLAVATDIVSVAKSAKAR